MFDDYRGRVLWLPIALFGVYFVYYYFSHRQAVPITGRKHMVDMTPRQEMALGIQSYQQILATSRVVESGKAVDAVLRRAVDDGAVPNVVAMAADGDGVLYEGPPGRGRSAPTSRSRRTASSGSPR